MKKRIIKLSILLVVSTAALSLIYFFPSNGYSKESKDVVDPSMLYTNLLPREDSKDTSHSFVKLAKINKFYKEDELNKLPKLDLIRIYKSRLRYIIEILPFIALHPEPGATFHDMSIPETETNIAHLDKEAKNKQEFVESLNETLDDVIPYAEKENIVWSILYYDKMIKESDYVRDSKK